MKLGSELTLTTRWVERHTNEYTGKLEVGKEIEYYGSKNQLIDSPIGGTIIEVDSKLFIEWDDGEENTELDGSDHMKDILDNCGWA